jgi:two-component system invasion response regulator UvrY
VSGDNIPTLTDVVEPPFTAASPTVDLSSLSARERQVLELLASGKRNSEIALELHLSPKTVSTYRLRVKEKLFIETNVAWMTLFRRVHGAPA